MKYSLYAVVKERYPDDDGYRVTPSLVADIRKELESTKFKAGPIKVANMFSVPPSMVRLIMREMPSPTTQFTKHSEDGWGREELRAYILGRKMAGEDWPANLQAEIELARTQFDQGIVEMVQGRDADFIIQYVIPRKRKTKRLMEYFVWEEQGLDNES